MLLVLDVLVGIIDGVRQLDLKGDDLANESHDDDLKASAQAKDRVEGWLFCGEVVRQGNFKSLTARWIYLTGGLMLNGNWELWKESSGAL
ncbi:hypothetical protein MVEG_01627 [Podila verticillata NRRL 6337]|nr:hypothetical protein MVEG_01627 [Podila verticillata NRRL 6337]